MSQSTNLPDISAIVLSYNTKDVTLRCVNDLTNSLKKSNLKSQIIVVDNASTDGSADALSTIRPDGVEYIFIKNGKNVGFSRGNNIALKRATGKYILYLNSDVLIGSLESAPNWTDLIARLEKDKSIAGLTVRVNLQNGEIDPASHRGFPTPLRSIFYFLGIENILRKIRNPKSEILKFFGGYHLMHLDVKAEHEIEACTAAFLLVAADVAVGLEGFDEQFFMYGEDLDLCYRIYQSGKKLLWFPKYSVTHLKYQSGIGAKSGHIKQRMKSAFYEAMWIFYRKHYEKQYGPFVTYLTWVGINLLALMKTGKTLVN